MKLDVLNEEVSIIKGEGSKSYTIDAENMRFAISAFYQYSDPLGSIIREITSNAYDAHVEAGVNKSVIVQIDLEGNILTILDFGVGLSPERVDTVFTKFFKSTKNKDNTQLGAFGLGSKSPLGYDGTDMYQVVTKYQDKVYEYIIHKSDGIPEFIKVEEREWQAPDPWKQDENGTKVIVPFNPSDAKSIVNKAKEQLSYFDNVFVDIFPRRYADEYEIDTFNNDPIYKGKHIIYRNSMREAGLHGCMGKVYYPIKSLTSYINNCTDPEKVIGGIVKDVAFEEGYENHPALAVLFKAMEKKTLWVYFNEIDRSDLGLYFEIGEIPIMWNRESIEYNDKAWKIIISKVIKAIIEIYELQLSHIKGTTSFLDILKLENSPEQEFFMGERLLETTGLKNTMAVLKTDYIQSATQLFHRLWIPHKDNIQGEVISGQKAIDVMLRRDMSKVAYLHTGERRKAGLKKYLKVNRFSLIVIPDHDYLLNLAAKCKLEEEQDVKNFIAYANEVIDVIKSRITYANGIDIPDDYKKGNIAKSSSIPILYSSLAYYSPHNLRRGDLQNTLKGTPKWGDLSHIPSLIIWALHEERDFVESALKYIQVSSIFKRKFGSKKSEGVVVCYISRHTSTYIHELVPSIHIKDFMLHRRAISNLATLHIIHEYFKKYTWFARMRNQVPDNIWYKLHLKGLISREDLNVINKVSSFALSYNYHSSAIQNSPHYHYVVKAIKSGFYHKEELDLVKKAHGLYIKYAPALIVNPDFLEEDTQNEAYITPIIDSLKLNIHPNLYRTYHVKKL